MRFNAKFYPLICLVFGLAIIAAGIFTLAAGRVVLAVAWVREDFPLPARGRGRPLASETRESLIHRLEPAVFFDRGLCAHYFTYMAGPKAYFVLFDTPRSIREKLDLAERLGLRGALLPGPELEPYLDEIFS